MELPQRKSIRLAHYDYSTCGAYFVTICTHNRRNTLSAMRRGDPCGRPQLHLSPLGQIVAGTFQRIEHLYGITFDSCVVMPNHVHFIVVIPAQAPEQKPISLGRIVGAFKSVISYHWLRICRERGQLMGPVWQRNYYEHVVRNDHDLSDIRTYIDNNPDRWQEDEYHNL